MNASNVPGAYEDVSVDEWMRFSESHHEHDYAVIDVRQPEEYAAGHVPGATLIPLGELVDRTEELTRLKGRTLLFYCRSGGRSSRAAGWASRALELPQVKNLSGGFMAWNGAALADFPRLKALPNTGDLQQLLRGALELEKGTHRLYELLASEYTSGSISSVIRSLASAEVAHGQAIHRVLGQLGGEGLEDFESLFASLPGELIESGESYEQVVEAAKRLGEQGELSILELALEIELTAYDLYRNLAARASDAKARAALEDLANQEKHHADAVMRAIGKAVEDSNRASH